MSKSAFKFSNKDLKRLETYINKVDDSIKHDVENQVKPVISKTKSIVKSHLKKGHGVDEGIYKKSIGHVIVDNSLGSFSFQVGAKKGHHRLTHLLENGHRIVSHGKDTGKKTRKIVHIKYGQDYVDEKVPELCEKAIKKAFDK